MHVQDFIECRESEAERIESWDSSPVYVCDRMGEYIEDNGFYDVEGAILDSLEDQGLQSPELEDRRDALIDRWEDRWWGPVQCCVRAGLDVASEPSGGVVGFTVGDLRRMYPEGFPTWLTEIDWDVPLSKCADSEGIWL